MMPYRCDVTRLLPTDPVKLDENRLPIRKWQTVISSMPCSAGHMNEKLSEQLARDVPIGRYYLRFPLDQAVLDKDCTSVIRHLNGDTIYPAMEILSVQRGKTAQIAIARRVG